MNTVGRFPAWTKRAAREHWLPLLLMVLPIHLVVWRSDTASFLFVMIVPFAAFVVGAALQPRHIWLVWLGSVVIQWIAMGIFGGYSDPGPNETATSLIIEAFFWMAFGVLIPCWIGRLIGGEAREDKHQEKPPKEFAS